ncbi:hypothetical protein Daudx_2030 [Candidatus Desulforudis audaxviator]|nr:hypothetical protein Daudx_2030 [Candidatus Desulforudis audaxviator]
MPAAQGLKHIEGFLTLQEKGGGCGKTGKASLQHRERPKVGCRVN